MSLLKVLFGPTLYRTHRPGLQGTNYEANKLEQYSTYTLNAVKCLWYICKLASPLWLVILYRKGVFSLDHYKDQDLSWVLRPFIFVTSVAGAACLVRSLGRYCNSSYLTFVRSMVDFERRGTRESAEKLVGTFDYDFRCLPVEFTATVPLKRPIQSPLQEKGINPVMSVLYKILAYALLKTIGRRLLYPGSLTVLNAAMASTLVEGRAKLMEQPDVKTKRAKIKTADGNHVDTMFVDNRNAMNLTGRTLVICCEGNASYYELGIMATPMDQGYSVIGWNHPGFGGSTGEPLPSQELHAIDAVMQYATSHLGFPVSNILMYAWSIGGFPASWVTAAYPEVAGVILDATFDDLLPLAHAHMPKKLATVVTHAVRNYLNLNVADLLCEYNGPILMIRRTNDEVLSIAGEDRSIGPVNRADFLLKRVLSHRYPFIINAETMPLLEEWLRTEPKNQGAFSFKHCREVTGMHPSKVMEDYLRQCSLTDPGHIRFPLDVGRNCELGLRRHLTLYLASLHMKDLEEKHCTPLPMHLFKKPWHPLINSNI